MKLNARHRAYWRRNVALTFTLLAVWALVTFGAAYFADELNRVSFLGFPLGFYVLAQGSLLTYLVIIGIYVVAMDRLDKKYGVGERR